MSTNEKQPCRAQLRNDPRLCTLAMGHDGPHENRRFGSMVLGWWNDANEGPIPAPALPSPSAKWSKQIAGLRAAAEAASQHAREAELRATRAEAASAVMRAAITGMDGATFQCANSPECSDEDEPVQRDEWCDACRDDAAIEAALASDAGRALLAERDTLNAALATAEERAAYAEGMAREEGERLRGALESVKAALGDRLLANGPLSLPYAHAVMAEINAALIGQRQPPTHAAEVAERNASAVRGLVDAGVIAAAARASQFPPADPECSSCGEECAAPHECPKSQRPCGHHCNHSWSQDECCWCGEEFTWCGGDEGEIHDARRTDAAALASQGAEVERLRADLAEQESITADVRAERDALRAEVERLRAVLRLEADYRAPTDDSPLAHDQDKCEDCAMWRSMKPPHPIQGTLCDAGHREIRERWATHDRAQRRADIRGSLAQELLDMLDAVCKVFP